MNNSVRLLIMISISVLSLAPSGQADIFSAIINPVGEYEKNAEHKRMCDGRNDTYNDMQRRASLKAQTEEVSLKAMNQFIEQITPLVEHAEIAFKNYDRVSKLHNILNDTTQNVEQLEIVLEAVKRNTNGDISQLNTWKESIQLVINSIKADRRPLTDPSLFSTKHWGAVLNRNLGVLATPEELEHAKFQIEFLKTLSSSIEAAQTSSVRSLEYLTARKFDSEVSLRSLAQLTSELLVDLQSEKTKYRMELPAADVISIQNRAEHDRLLNELNVARAQEATAYANLCH